MQGDLSIYREAHRTRIQAVGRDVEEAGGPSRAAVGVMLRSRCAAFPASSSDRPWQAVLRRPESALTIPSPTVAPAVLSYTQAASYLGLPSVGALRNLVYRRAAPPSIAYGKRDRRFRRADVDAWLEAKASAARVDQAVMEAGRPSAPRRPGRPTKAEAAARRQASGNR